MQHACTNLITQNKLHKELLTYAMSSQKKHDYILLITSIQEVESKSDKRSELKMDLKAKT